MKKEKMNSDELAVDLGKFSKKTLVNVLLDNCGFNGNGMLEKLKREEVRTLLSEQKRISEKLHKLNEKLETVKTPQERFDVIHKLSRLNCKYGICSRKINKFSKQEGR